MIKTALILSSLPFALSGVIPAKAGIQVTVLVGPHESKVIAGCLGPRLREDD